MTSSDSTLATFSTWSSTSVTARAGSNAAVKRSIASGIEVERLAMASTVGGSTPATRPNAIAAPANSEEGSLSLSSNDSQATSLRWRADHWASTVVLPYPGGATMAIVWPAP